MTLNGKMILNYLKQNYGKEFTKAQIAHELHVPIPAVNGTVNFLVKRGAVDERAEIEEVAPATETRKAATKTIRYVQINETGLAFDPEND